MNNDRRKLRALAALLPAGALGLSISLASATANATASDVDGTVSRVDFTLGTLTVSDTTAPYSATFSNLAAGTYMLTAKATDNQGAVGTSPGHSTAAA